MFTHKDQDRVDIIAVAVHPHSVMFDEMVLDAAPPVKDRAIRVLFQQFRMRSARLRYVVHGDHIPV